MGIGEIVGQWDSEKVRKWDSGRVEQGWPLSAVSWWQVLLLVSLTTRTEILRFAQNDCPGSMSMLYHSVMPNRKLLAKGFLLK